MRWIDAHERRRLRMMDLQERSRSDLAARFLSGYLEATGDYDGLDVLRFYLVYRSMVRAKVARLRVGQVEPAEEREKLIAEYRAYVALARRQSDRQPGAILITHGLPGSGKTTVAQALLERTGAVRIRTDIERKRLHGLDAGEQSHSAGAMRPSGRQTTARRRLARSVARAGYPRFRWRFPESRQRDLLRHARSHPPARFVISP